MKLVIVESPFFVKDDLEKTNENITYAQECMLDSLTKGESPMLSHLLYTQVLDDNNPAERAMGISAGLEWGKVAEASIIYVDLGISPGMEKGIKNAIEKGRPLIFRNLYPETYSQMENIRNRYIQSPRGLGSILERLSTSKKEEDIILDELKNFFKGDKK